MKKRLPGSRARVRAVSAPAGTRRFNVRLVSTRNAGTNNDGDFDALSLTADEVPEPSSFTRILGGLVGRAGLRRKKQR